MRKRSGAAWRVALKHADYGPAPYAAGPARDDGAGGCVAARITRSSLSAPPQREQAMGLGADAAGSVLLIRGHIRPIDSRHNEAIKARPRRCGTPRP